MKLEGDMNWLFKNVATFEEQRQNTVRHLWKKTSIFQMWYLEPFHSIVEYIRV
jgi:hypothetical protein